MGESKAFSSGSFSFANVVLTNAAKPGMPNQQNTSINLKA